MSLFITGLAFDDASIIAESKIGILFASAVAGILGLLILHRASARSVRVSPAATAADVLGDDFETAEV